MALGDAATRRVLAHVSTHVGRQVRVELILRSVLQFLMGGALERVS
jgi:hypothetical protein